MYDETEGDCSVRGYIEESICILTDMRRLWPNVDLRLESWDRLRTVAATQ